MEAQFSVELLEVRRCYSTNLPQGGLEVLCMLIFRMCNAKDVEKVKRILDEESVSFSTLIVIEKN